MRCFDFITRVTVKVIAAIWKSVTVTTMAVVIEDLEISL
jgi:hypothetical protein